MRFIAIFPLLCALVAFILSLLCIFAGSSPNYLENYDLLTLNTSLLGSALLSDIPSPSSNESGILGQLEGELGQLEQDLKGELTGAIHSIAQALNIHDFYSVHLMDFCEGFFEPGPIANATVNPTKNVTDCSNRTAGFTFDPQAAIQSQLKPGVSLDDVKWPKEVEDGVRAAETAVNAMFVLYCIGVGFAGLAGLGALAAFFMDGRLSALVDSMLCFLAFLSLGIASAIATALIAKSVDAINYYGNEIGIAANKGSGFLGLTWAATVLMFVAGVGWIFDCCVGPSRRTRSKV